MAEQLDDHGGNIHKYRKTGTGSVNREDILDYSANINPQGLPSSLKQIIKSKLVEIACYPDPYCTELREDISKYLNVPIEKIVVGNGAAEIIFLIFDVLCPKKVLIPAPTFSEYGKAAEISGSKIVYFERKEADGFNLDIEELAGAVDRDIEAVLICNPNNPTSTLINKCEMEKFINKCCEWGVYVIVDEAFIELTEGANSNSVVNLVDIYNNLFVIRAFTKYFAMPGLRLGYGIGNIELIKRMEQRRIPWSVNTFACSVGKLLSVEGDYMDKTAVWIKEEKEWLYNQLREISIFKVFQPKTNFILVKILVEGMDAGILKERMLAKGILIRHAGNFKYLDNRFFRIAVKDRDSNKRFLKAVREVVEGWEEQVNGENDSCNRRS